MSESVLVPHKFNNSRYRGIIVGANPQNSNYYKEGTTKNGKPWRTLRFGIKTSPKQTIYVELFGQEYDKVYPYSKNEKKSMIMDWKDRFNLPSGYNLIGVTVGSKNTIFTDYDAIPQIMENFKDGDSIFVSCDNKFSKYNGNLQVKYSVKSIYKTSEEIDFEDPEFKEQSEFTQELTITDVDVDKELEKVFINAYIIEAQGKDKLPLIHPAQFTVDLNNENKNMVKAMQKVKFGTNMKVKGFVHNDVVLTEVTEDTEWGKQSAKIEGSRREMKIIEVDAVSVEIKKYKEADFLEALEAQNTTQIFDQPAGDNVVESNQGSQEEEVPDWMKGL